MAENERSSEAASPEEGNDSEERDASIATENLKTLRLLHQILMVVSAAVLAFALRPDLSNEYKAALDELSTLKEVSFNSWPAFISGRYKKYQEENNNFVMAVIRLSGLEIQGHPKLQEPIFGDAPPDPGARLIELDAFFGGARKIGNLKIEGNKRYMAEQLKKAAASRNSHPAVSAMSASAGSSGPYGLTGLGPAAGPMSIFFVINDQPQTAPNGPVYVIASYTTVSDTGNFALEWLRGESFGRRLVDKKTNVVFPNLKVFWDRVNLLTQDQATVFLQDELSATGRGTLSFFGIPVERNVAVAAGPAICFSILVFIGLHLKHLRGLQIERHEIGSYPWIALFRGPLSLIATYLSALVLPIIANGVLLRRYGHWPEPSTRVGLVLTVLTLAAAGWTIVEIHRLRARGR